MKTELEYAHLLTDDDWKELSEELDPAGASRLLPQLLQRFRGCGAVMMLEESAYIDRDFSSAYAAFYSTLYRLRSKLCRRIHFFGTDLSAVFQDDSKEAVARGLQDANRLYLGYVVIRPVKHAPVGSAIVSSRHFEQPGTTIEVRSDYKVHLLGAELTVRGIPITEQDKRTGACAQATIWTAGRHFHNRYAMPWFSVTDITEAALKPVDAMLSRSLPAGSDYLMADNMVRALRTMGEHPIVYSRDENDKWIEGPGSIISRYVDSGIPVIVGLSTGEGIGHAVVAVGTEQGQAPSKIPAIGATTGDRVSSFVVMDDQRGAYLSLPARAVVGKRGKPGESGAAKPAVSGYALKDALFLLVPLPSKVFMKAEVAETLARDKLAQIISNRREHVATELPDLAFEDWLVDPDFYGTPATELVARTYLTLGWKYKHRLMRNTVPEELKDDLTGTQLPRYVWVTELSLASDLVDLDPCRRRVRAHVVTDATGTNSSYDDAVLVTHLPGIILTTTFDPETPNADSITRLTVLTEDRPYYPKVRDWRDYDACATPSAAMSEVASKAA